MRSFLKTLVALCLIFPLTAFMPGEDATVLIDGKPIVPEGDITLKRDDTIMLECVGLKPNSNVSFIVRKAAIKWYEDVYAVNGSGNVKQLLDIPEQKLTVTCIVSYYTADDAEHEVKFKLHFD